MIGAKRVLLLADARLLVAQRGSKLSRWRDVALARARAGDLASPATAACTRREDAVALLPRTSTLHIGFGIPSSKALRSADTVRPPPLNVDGT
jgi:hypothetical protein